MKTQLPSARIKRTGMIIEMAKRPVLGHGLGLRRVATRSLALTLEELLAASIAQPSSLRISADEYMLVKEDLCPETKKYLGSSS
jgi:hypothetical protein